VPFVEFRATVRRVQQTVFSGGTLGTVPLPERYEENQGSLQVHFAY
jgi:hypothetical protein